MAKETVNTKYDNPKTTVNIRSIDSQNRSSDYSLRSEVFSELTQNNGLTPKEICKKLSLAYKVYGHSVRTYKCQYNRQYQNRVAQKSLSFHKWQGRIYVPDFVRQNKAVGLGDGKVVWQTTKAKNRMIVFDARSKGLGRLEWFQTGRVNIYVQTPGNKGRLKRLLAMAFYASNLMFDVKLFDKWAESARMKGAHLINDLGVALPYSKTEFLQEGLGVVVKTGDKTHPTGVEIEFGYPDWAEKNERFLALNKVALNQTSEAITQSTQAVAQNTQVLKRLFPEQPKEVKPSPIPQGAYE